MKAAVSADQGTILVASDASADLLMTLGPTKYLALQREGITNQKAMRRVTAEAREESFANCHTSC